nr:amidohydrolase family protein [Algoriphagus yeomjeoni]
MLGKHLAAVLYYATQQNAEAFRIDYRAGSISPGKWGDLMIIKGNPIENINRTLLLILKGIHRIGPGSLNCMISDG